MLMWTSLQATDSQAVSVERAPIETLASHLPAASEGERVALDDPLIPRTRGGALTGYLTGYLGMNDASVAGCFGIK